MRGELTLTILKLLQASAMTSVQLLDILTYYGRTAHYSRMRGYATPLPDRKPILEDAIAKRERRLRASKLISKLRAEGIVEEDTSNSGALVPTSKGIRKLSALEGVIASAVRVNRMARSAASQEVKIVVFDIPEKKRNLRDVLRGMLKLMKFSMLQKSAWIGNATIPKEFFEWLAEHDLLAYVEVLAVTKQGTLKQLK